MLKGILFFIIFICGASSCGNSHVSKHNFSKLCLNENSKVDSTREVEIIQKKRMGINSYQYGLKLLYGEYSIIVLTTCYDENLFYGEEGTEEEDRIKEQRFIFLRNQDTIYSEKAPSRIKLIENNNAHLKLSLSQNRVHTLSIIKGKNNFFYFISGGEDCVSLCPEYVSFISKKGSLLWELYLKEKGDYFQTLEEFMIDDSFFKPNSILKYWLVPYEWLGTTSKSSMLKVVK